MHSIKKALQLFNNYVLARIRRKPSTAFFWYLPEPPTIQKVSDLETYKKSKKIPIYLMDYRRKLEYTLENEQGIIVLPYPNPIGSQVNPEAAFQYALGLHHQYGVTDNKYYLEKFWNYVNYFIKSQNNEGLWAYEFDWYGSKAPWYSALAQARGASLMLRAWLLSEDSIYFEASKKAVAFFSVPTDKGGFLHPFPHKKCFYFEEYPKTPTGVLNGFMASILCLWELRYWMNEKWIDDLFNLGLHSLEMMFPAYSTDWWSLYDLDSSVPLANINSPRYHLLEVHYLQVLSILTDSFFIKEEYEKRYKQYQKHISKIRAIYSKVVRKIYYR